MPSSNLATLDQLITALPRAEPLAGRVASQLEQLILQQQIPAGQRLPSERDLADQFGVSRTVIREAVRTLAARGLLDVRSGRGTIVRALTTEAAVESMSRLLTTRSHRFDYEKVGEVRRVLEVEIAGLAAERRQPDDIRALETVLERAQEKLEDPETFIETDVGFHEALARATHNDLFLVILSSIAHVMRDVRRLGLRVPGTPARALDYHRRIFDAVRAGDAEGARRAMSQHMDEARQTIAEALKSDAAPAGLESGRVRTIEA
jgi:GntR family transcriptional repressor for pyruvate dehydrogenase complex